MDASISSHHFSELRKTVDDLFAMRLQVVPAISCSVDRDEYTGLNEFNDWRDSGCDNTVDPDQFGLEGTEILGRWSEDGSVFNGFFPVTIRPDGEYVLVRKWRERSPEEVHRQIDLAEEYGYPLGIAVNTLNFRHFLDQDCQAPNSVIYSDPSTLQQLAGESSIRIESDGNNFWAYPFVDFRSDDIFDWFDGASSRHFGLVGTDYSVGRIRKGAIVPAYPSYIFGKQIKLVTPGTQESRLIIPSAESVGIHFDVEVTKDDEMDLIAPDSYPDLEVDWFNTPEEDEEIFERSVAAYDKAIKPSKQLIRYNPPGVQEQTQSTSTETEDIDLHRFLPGRLATSVSLVKENLPYDNMCVLVTFLTCAAGMLRLGTKVTGNKMTRYSVPINFYTILRAASGRKKSALGDLFALDPAADVLLKVAQQNDRAMRKWQEDCHGKKAADKPPQPVPLDIRLNDYTSEALVQALAKLDEEGRAVTIVRDEVSALFESMNAYKSGKGADEQQLLELYDGRGYRSLRVGDKGRAYSRAAVNICGSIQPDVLDNLLRNGDASGMWARFIFIALPDLTKKLPTKYDSEQLNALEEAQQHMRDVVSTLFELPAMEYSLDTEAMELFADYELKKQEDALLTKISAQAALYGKSAGKVLRFAGILHILQFTVNHLRASKLISREILQKAIELVDCLDRWTLACHAKLAGVTTEGLTPFQRRLHSIALTSKSSMSWSDIRQKMSSTEKKGKVVKDAEEAMSKCVALGLGEVTKGPSGGLYYKALKPLPA